MLAELERLNAEELLVTANRLAMLRPLRVGHSDG
jgi:hypothetical protein